MITNRNNKIKNSAVFSSYICKSYKQFNLGLLKSKLTKKKF